jgi:hypothetical protein
LSFRLIKREFFPIINASSLEKEKGALMLFFKYFLSFLVLLFFQNIYAQNTNYFYKNPENEKANEANLKAAKTAKNFSLDIDLTPKVGDAVSQADSKKLPFYFAVVTKDGKTDTVASYDKTQNIQDYMLDREFNLYFAFLKIEYQAKQGKISKMNLYDKQGILKAYILYNWKTKDEDDENPYLDSVEVFAYSSAKKDLTRVQSRFFSYGGGAFDKNIKNVHFGKGNLSKFSNEFYGSGNTIVSYTRYAEDGSIQYSKNLTYNGKTLSQVQVYNKDGVLLATEKPQTKTDDNVEQNEDFSPANLDN